MSLKADMGINNPGKVVFRLTMTMTVDEWKSLKGALVTAKEVDHWHPANQTIRAIDDLVAQVNKSYHFWGEDPGKDPL